MPSGLRFVKCRNAAKSGLDMKNEQQTGEYQANDAEVLMGKLFSGGISVEEAIERLRNRLLDLSARNRLLNYW